MHIENKIAAFFGLKNIDEWLKHANPWSVWSRFLTLPLIIVCIWSRTWIGHYSIIPIVVIFIWVYVNPKLFSKAKSTNNWASKAVLGELVWSRRSEIAVPDHHHTAIMILTLLQIMAAIMLIIGLYQCHFWLMLSGMIYVYFSKMWFLDRMVWVFTDMRNHEKYNQLLY